MSLNRLSRAGRSRKRWISIVWILIISSVIGGIEFAEPLEDMYRGGRNYLRQRPADGNVAIVALDDRSVLTFGRDRFPLAKDAQLLDQLFASGVRRVYFDRVYMDPTDKANDEIFISALKRYQGRVFLGSITSVNQSGTPEHILSHPNFLRFASASSLNGHMTPFSLSAELVYGTDFPIGYVRSISSDIAEISGKRTDYYRPDWAIKASTVPTFSYVTVLSGDVPANALMGKDVIVGPTSFQYRDSNKIIGQGWVSGVYFHAIGAQTLKEGKPANWGWLPAYAAALAMSILILCAKTRREAWLVNSIAVIMGLGLPFLADAYFITADFIPAYLLFGFISYRTNALRELATAQRHHEGTNLPTLPVLFENRKAKEMLIIAMRIRNYAAICASFRDPIGHELVTELARRMQLTSNTPVYYQAEDVLYLLSPILDCKALEEHLQGLAQLLETQLSIGGRMVDIQTSFGIDRDINASTESRTSGALYAADIAAAANRQWEIYYPGADDAKSMKLSLMSELNLAMDRGELWLAYQPQMDIRTNAVVGAEALARWNHPEYGFIPPDEFIRTAERYNRVTRLTLYLLELGTTACKQVVEEHPDFRLSINLSAMLLEDPSLPAQITQVLARTDFPSINLTLEITETASFVSRDIANNTLNNLQAIGIRISIDDYGMGNATLDYLKTIPWDEVKLDRQFISDITHNASDRHMVETTIDLAHRLRRNVVAEGIEDRATLDLLRQIGCDFAQGYYLAKPMPLDQFLQFLAAYQCDWPVAGQL